MRLLALLIAAAVVGSIWMPNWSSAASRLLAALEFVPSVGSVEITKVTPGNADVLVGESVDIAAEISESGGKPHHAALWVRPTKRPRRRGHGRRREARALPADRPFGPQAASVSSGDRRFANAGLYGRRREKPAVESVEVTFHYPAYLGRKNDTIRQKGLDIEAPQYTLAELRLRLSAPVAKGYLDSEGERFPGRVEEGGKLLVASMPLLKDTTYSVRLFDDTGHTDPNPRLNRVAVLPDKPPTVELLKPNAESSASPAGDVPVTIRAGDDHGLSGLRLEMKVQAAAVTAPDGGSKPAADTESVTLVKQWNDFAGDSTTAVRHHLLKFTPEMAKPGQTVLIRAVAWDRREVSDWGLTLGKQESASGWHAVKIVAQDAQATAALDQLDKLRDAIWKVLEKQLLARKAAAALVAREQLAERIAGAVEVARAAGGNPKELAGGGPVDWPGRRPGAAGHQARHEWPGLRRYAPGGDLFGGAGEAEGGRRVQKAHRRVDRRARPDCRRAAEVAGRNRASAKPTCWPT